MIFHRRSRRDGTDPYLQAKITLFGVGAVLGMAGIGLESSMLVGMAIFVLGLGMVLSWLSKREAGSPAESEEGDDGHEADERD